MMACYCMSLPTYACNKSVKSAMVAVFTPQANTTNQSVFSPESQMCHHTAVQGWALVLMDLSKGCWHYGGPGAQLCSLGSSPSMTSLPP